VSQVAPCEWIVGWGPGLGGSVGRAPALDDISPPLPSHHAVAALPGVLPEDQLAASTASRAQSVARPSAAPQAGAAVCKHSQGHRGGSREPCGRPPCQWRMLLLCTPGATSCGQPSGPCHWHRHWRRAMGQGHAEPNPEWGPQTQLPEPQLQAAATAKSLWAFRIRAGM